MPGTYPRSTNLYFPFDRLAWIETQLNLFHDLSYSSSFTTWARSSVFTSLSQALMVAKILNEQNKGRLDGRFVVVPANEIIVWCRAIVFDEKSKAPTSGIDNWTAPVADKGFIIVWEPRDQVVLTAPEYISRFGRTSQIDRIIKIVKGSGDCDRNEDFGRTLGHVSNSNAQLPIDYKPVRKLPILENCPTCGETKSFCRCI
jgi:hypothetical protein